MSDWANFGAVGGFRMAVLTKCAARSSLRVVTQANYSGNPNGSGMALERSAARDWAKLARKRCMKEEKKE
jgi:hypothetical protein